MTTPAPPESEKCSTGLDPNLAAALAYLGGAITGVVFLVIERDSRYVRFHAMQSTITFLGVLVVHLLFVSTPVIGWLLSPVFITAVLLLWGFLMFKALNGQRYKLPYIGDFAEQQLGQRGS